MDYVQQPSDDAQTDHNSHKQIGARDHHHDDERSHSPTTVLEVDYVDIPALVEEHYMSTTEDEES